MSSLNSLPIIFVARASESHTAQAVESAARPRLETGCVLSAEPAVKNARAIHYFAQLAQTLSAVKAPNGGPRVFALTAAKSGDGVTFTARSLAGALARAAGASILIADADILGRQSSVRAPEPGFGHSEQGAVYSVTQTASSHKKWDARFVRHNVEEIGRHFSWVLVDCPPLGESDHALAIAPHTNGVVFVAAAGHTKRSDIAQARRAIEFSSGTLLGFVLNKRTWPVAESLYQRL